MLLPLGHVSFFFRERSSIRIGLYMTKLFPPCIQVLVVTPEMPRVVDIAAVCTVQMSNHWVYTTRQYDGSNS
jgi:hypothetical protein